MKRLAGLIKYVRRFCTRFAAQWRADTERIEAYCRTEATQRDKDDGERLQARGVIK